MKDVNKVILMGRLGNDPVLRETKSGVPVAQFSMATSRRLRQSEAGEEATAPESELPEGATAPKPQEETQWHRVVVWGRQGEICSKFLKKGHAVYVEGSVRSRKYETKEGEPRLSYEIHAEDVSFLMSPRAQAAS